MRLLSLNEEYALFEIVYQICHDIEQSSLQETLSPFHTLQSAALASAYLTSCVCKKTIPC